MPITIANRLLRGVLVVRIGPEPCIKWHLGMVHLAEAGIGLAPRVWPMDFRIV